MQPGVLSCTANPIRARAYRGARVKIVIDLYDATQCTSLTADEMATRFVSAVLVRWPDATIETVCDSHRSRVYFDDFRAGDLETITCEQLREVIGRAWEQATEEHPYVRGSIS